MMKMTEFYDKIRRILPDLEIVANELMSKHTSFRIGGPAAIMAFPKSGEELSNLLKQSGLMDIKTVILGAGTNVLAPDAGLRKLVIVLKDALEGMEQLSDTSIRFMAGVTMSRAAVFAAGLNLGGHKNAQKYKVLNITIPEDLDYTDVFEPVLREYTASHELEQVRTTNMGSLFRLSYYIVMKDPSKEKELIDKLQSE